MSIVYAARNPAMPGLIKIGRTDQEADARLSQLYTTGVPVPFQVCDGREAGAARHGGGTGTAHGVSSHTD